jgi:hypothetical protein
MSEHRTRTATVAANGTATVTIQPYGARLWRVSQVSVEMPVVPAGGLCNLRHNGALVSPLTPNRGVAQGPPAVDVLPEDVLTVEWSGMTPGTLGKVYFIYDEVQ